MKATINGITYEGTEEEIRRIVENPPNGGTVSYPGTPYPPHYVPTPTYPTWPPEVPNYPSNGDWPWGPRRWDGAPIVTCCIDGDFLC